MCLTADGFVLCCSPKLQTLFSVLHIFLMLSWRQSSYRYFVIASESSASILGLRSLFFGLLHIEPHVKGICSHFKIHAGRSSGSQILADFVILLCHRPREAVVQGGSSLSLRSARCRGAGSLWRLAQPLLVLTLWGGASQACPTH